MRLAAPGQLHFFVGIRSAPPFQYGCRRFGGSTLQPPPATPTMPDNPIPIHFPPYIYIYIFFFGSPAAAALRISNRFLCFFLRKNHVALIKYCWQVSFGRSLFCFWPGLCIEMSFWFYTREFAVNCYQLRIKFYNIHVSLAIRFFMISFRSSDSDWYCGIYPGFFFIKWAENKSNQCQK